MKYLFFTTILFIVVYITSCKQETISVNNKSENLSAFYPLSIPLEERQLEYKKGNKVPNCSFEKGSTLNTDSLVKQFGLENWEIIGENVQWVDVNNKSYTSDEVSKGSHAIKIERSRKDVKDLNNESSGVLSDFIEVIPGNYLFYVDIKMKDVYPSCPRLNSKLGTDVDIRIKFFDKDKKEISPGVYFDYWHQEVDNSFKGFAFSNFYNMPELKWSKVKCRTLNYPFSEGDMPDGCKYVKLYLGFKGRGTVWYDNVDFRLSKWNFTTLERLKPMFEKVYDRTELIVPKPKKILYLKIINFSDKSIYIVTPNEQINANISALNLLKRYFPEAKIVKNEADIIDNNALVFSIGETYLYRNYVSKLNIDEIKDKEQSYIIQKIEDNNNQLIFLKGGLSPIGNYYAATTLVQLVDTVSNTYYHADIIDYPDFIGRSYVLNSYKNRWEINRDATLSDSTKAQKINELDKMVEQNILNVEDFAFYKLNKIYNSYGSLSKQWWKPGKVFSDLVEGLGEKSKKLGVINYCVMINPYYHFEYESQEANLSDSLRNIFSHSNPKDIDKIKQVILKALDNGANTVMICADDFVPHRGKKRGIYALFTDADKKAYFNMANAQADMINNIRNWLDNINPNIRLEFCPAPYLNQFIDYGRGSAEAFFRDLAPHTPKDMAIIWTGNTVRSLCIDDVDIKRYSDLIERKPMLWDNTPYAREIEGQYGGYPAHYPGKAVMCNLFEPYDIIVPENFHKKMNNHIYSNQTGYTERQKIKYATFADFAWNCNEYDADFSLFKTLVGMFGKANAYKLLQFNDYYYKLVSIWAKIRNGKQDETPEKPYIISNIDIENAQQIIINLKTSYEELEKTVSNKRLLDELKNTMNKKIEDFNNIIKEKEKVKKVGHKQT